LDDIFLNRASAFSFVKTDMDIDFGSLFCFEKPFCRFAKSSANEKTQIENKKTKSVFFTPLYRLFRYKFLWSLV